jgi:hypothetical protein
MINSQWHVQTQRRNSLDHTHTHTFSYGRTYSMLQKLCYVPAVLICTYSYEEAFNRFEVLLFDSVGNIWWQFITTYVKVITYTQLGALGGPYYLFVYQGCYTQEVSCKEVCTERERIFCIARISLLFGVTSVPSPLTVPKWFHLDLHMAPYCCSPLQPN